MNRVPPPQPVDVSRDDLRGGKFRLNPGADAWRALEHGPRGWIGTIAFAVGFLAGFFAGATLACVAPVVHISFDWGVIGIFAIMVAYIVCIAIYMRATGRPLARPWTHGILAFAIGLLAGLSQ